MFFFFRLDFEFCWFGWKEFLPSRARVILCGQGTDDARWDKFSVSWKGLRVDWELPLRQQSCAPPANIGRLVRSPIFWLLSPQPIAILNPVDTFRHLLQVPLPSRKHDGSDPVVPSISRHLLCGGLILGSWWLTSWGTPEKGMVTVLVAASRPKRGKWTTQQLCKSKLSSWQRATLDGCCFLLWIWGLSPLSLTQVNTHWF